MHSQTVSYRASNSTSGGWLRAFPVMAVAGLALVLAACGGGASGTAGASPTSTSKPETTVIFGVSSKAPGGNMLQLGIAQTEGYFAAEGIDIQPVFLGSGAAVMQALAAGKIQIGTPTPDVALEGIDKGQKVKMFYNWTSKNVTEVGVFPDSPIKSVADLKGRTVGVQDLGAGPAQLMRAALASVGLDPDKDVKWIAVGTGASALDALERGRIDAMVTYDTLFSAMESGAGKTLRLFQPSGVEDLFASSFAASDGWMKDNPGVAAGFGRAWAKASVFADANPQAGVQMMFKLYPNSQVGSGDAATKAALAQFAARAQSLYGASGKPPADQKWGYYPPDAVTHWIEYTYDNKLISTKLNVEDVYTNEFTSQFNDFDSGAIVKAAMSTS